MPFVDDFNIAGKTPQELGQMLIAELAKGIWAAREDRVDQLLAANASLEERDEKGHTPLLMAASHGLTKMAIKIIDRNADINAVTKRNESALILTLQPVPAGLEQADEEYLDIAKALLKKKADVKIVSINKETALTVAAGRGLFFFTQDIIALGPDFDQKDWSGEDALTKAKKNDYIRTTELLESGLKARDELREQERQHQEVVVRDENIARMSTLLSQGTTKAIVAPETAVFKPRTPKTSI